MCSVTIHYKDGGQAMLYIISDTLAAEQYGNSDQMCMNCMAIDAGVAECCTANVLSDRDVNGVVVRSTRCDCRQCTLLRDECASCPINPVKCSRVPG